MLAGGHGLPFAVHVWDVYMLASRAWLSRDFIWCPTTACLHVFTSERGRAPGLRVIEIALHFVDAEQCRQEHNQKRLALLQKVAKLRLGSQDPLEACSKLVQWSVRDNTAEFQGQGDTVVGGAPDRMKSSPVSIGINHHVPALP